jgi:FHS family L-fucose permease-like MFS transporter
MINSFRVRLTAAGFLAFAFFIAYGVMSIPGGFLVERFTEKPAMVLAFLAGTWGIAELYSISTGVSQFLLS